MSRRTEQPSGAARDLPLLDAEMWDAPARLSVDDCLEEVAAGLVGLEWPRGEDDL